ncbi:MAG: proton-conducting transporter membrane subunit [Cyclobacteriaceae bacterium]|nr:proton-conducting transporter membrane subunit [Cyclobacteriaceae bacterium]
MNTFLLLFLVIPLLGFILNILTPKRKENLISQIAYSTAGLQLLSTMILCTFWVVAGFPNLNIKEFVIYSADGYEFFIDLYFDKITAVYLFVGSLLTFLVTTYSKYYLHREKGYKRFFVTVLFFFLGYNITIFSGNFETLFIGWEILGISSFLLIAFYRERYLPVKNAIKVYSLYRIADLSMILVMWMSHHLWHHNIIFAELNNATVVQSTQQGHLSISIIVALLISVAAAIKSAQFPFSSWLPRAMEGPTPSSAIFYSSLAVHIGAFLLLRTFPFWENLIIVRVIIITMGVISTIIATMTARVQPTVKSQIAYSSIAQIGIIFIEITLGFENLALIHFATNAFLRTYQLLVSPSVVTYLIREQFYNIQLKTIKTDNILIRKIKYSIYILSLKEWNMDSLMFRYLWNPLKILGRKSKFISHKSLVFVFLPIFLVFSYFMYHKPMLPSIVLDYLPTILSFVSLLLVFRSFSERKNTFLSWSLLLFSHFWISMSVSFNEDFNADLNIIYLSGVVVSGIWGYLCLWRLKGFEKIFDLNRFYGYSYEHPKLALLFFIACLGIAGFPITSTFLGEDLLYSHIHEDQFFLALFVSMNFIITGLSGMRIFSRIFLGPHSKTYHEIALRSS